MGARHDYLDYEIFLWEKEASYWKKIKVKTWGCGFSKKESV